MELEPDAVPVAAVAVGVDCLNGWQQLLYPQNLLHQATVGAHLILDPCKNSHYYGKVIQIEVFHYY